MSDDLIKRKDAIKAFTLNSKGERIPFVDCGNFPVEFPLRYIVDTLAALPPTDRLQGEWTKMDVATYRCSECGKIQISDDDNELNFCCCCGSQNKVRRTKGDRR